MRQPFSKNSINLILALVFGVVWAFFWAVDQIVTYVLFGLAVFFVALYFYNRKIEADEKEAQHTTRNRAGFDRTQENKTRTSQRPIFYGKDKQQQSLSWVVIGIVGLVLFSLWFNFWPMNDSSEPTLISEAGTYSFYERAEKKYSEGEYDSAHYLYKQALREEPERQEALLGLGNTLHMQNKKDSSLLLYKRVVELNPNYSTARYNIGWWYYDQQQYEVAIGYTKKFVLDEPENAAALQLIGDSFYEQNLYDSAFQWYEGAYTNGARSRWLCHVLGYLHDRSNSIDRAISLYKEALEYDTTNAEIYVRLGELLPGEQGDDYRYRAAQLKIAKEN